MLSAKFLAFVFGSWLILMVLAIVNAGIREGFYSGFMDELAAHQASTVTLMVIIVLFTFLLLRLSGMELSAEQAVVMGVLWTLTTVAFEFLAGHYVFGNSWDALLAEYDILEGRLWLLIPATTLIAPYLIHRLL